MNRVADNSANRGGGGGEDELDALLGAFFKAEMPAPWPAFVPPASAKKSAPSSTKKTLPFRRPDESEQRPTRRRWHGWTSRLALAASVALLLLGTWLMPSPTGGGRIGGGNPPTIGTEGDGTANPKDGLPGPATDPGKKGKLTPKDVKSSIHLEQGEDGRTGVNFRFPDDLPSEDNK